MKKWVIKIVKLTIFLGLGLFIAWFSIKNLTEEQTKNILDSFRNANYNWVFLSVIIGMSSHVFRALRWQILLEPLGHKPSFRNTLVAVMVGYFANMAIPRLGEVTRCGVLLTTDNYAVNKSFGTVITERMIDLLTFFILLVVVFFTQINILKEYFDIHIFPRIEAMFGFANSKWALVLIMIAILAFFFIIFLFIKLSKPKHKFLFRLKTVIVGFFDGMKSLLKIKKPFLFFVYSIAIWGTYLLMTWTCFFCLSETSELGLDIGLAVLVTGSIGIMVTAGGIGLYPVIVRNTLVLYGVASTSGFAVGWITWSAQTAMILIAGVGSLIWLSFIKKKKLSLKPLK